MSDIFKEVEEDLRRERLSRLWRRFGIYVIAAAVLIVAATAGWRGYDAWRTGRARAAGDAFVAALEEARGARTASAAEALLAYAGEAPEGYALLARLRAATVFEQADEPERAATVLKGLADDADVPVLYRDLARVRLAQVHLDADAADAAARAVASIAQDPSNPFHWSAQELTGLAAYVQDDLAEARERFAAVARAVGAPPALQQRAQVMLALIAQVAPEEGDTQDAQDAADEDGAAAAAGGDGAAREAAAAGAERAGALEETN